MRILRSRSRRIRLGLDRERRGKQEGSCEDLHGRCAREEHRILPERRGGDERCVHWDQHELMDWGPNGKSQQAFAMCFSRIHRP